MNHKDYLKNRIKDDDLYRLDHELQTDLVKYITSTFSTLIKSNSELELIEDLFSEKDYERVFVLPNIVKILFDRKCLESDVQEVIFFNWLLFTLQDKEYDRKDLEISNKDLNELLYICNRNLERSSLNLKFNYRINLDKLNKNLHSIDLYRSSLQEIYGDYGELISSQIQNCSLKKKSMLSRYLTTILVIQKLLDDLADWEQDLINACNTNVTYILEKNTRGVTDGKIVKKQKYIFIIEVLPTYIKECESLYSYARSNIDQPILISYLDREVIPVKKMRSIIDKKVTPIDNRNFL